MKKNKTALFVTATVLAFLFILGVAYAQDDIKSLKHDVFIERERPAAVFPHVFHTDEAEIDCLMCHHIYDETGENIWDDSSESECAECHKLEGDGKVLPLMRIK